MQETIILHKFKYVYWTKVTHLALVRGYMIVDQ